MNIEKTYNINLLYDLEEGEVFKYDDNDYYMKTDLNSDEYYLCLRIRDGATLNIKKDKAVLSCPQAKIII